MLYGVASVVYTMSSATANRICFDPEPSVGVTQLRGRHRSSRARSTRSVKQRRGSAGSAHNGPSAIQIIYPGVGNNSTFVYNGLGRCVKIIETNNSAVTSTKQIWLGEERDASGNITKQFFSRGQTISAVNYFYTFDHLNSVREMTDGSGTLHAVYVYDQYGQVSQVQGDQSSDRQYGGYYQHARSGLNITFNRCYLSSLGRWMSRDPIGEQGGINLMSYVNNNPISFSDPSGLRDVEPSDLGLNQNDYNYYGCISIVDALLGIGAGKNPTNPNNMPPGSSTKCWWGDGRDVTPAKEQAEKHKCKDGKKPKVWCKQGLWLKPGMQPGAPGTPLLPPNSNGNVWDTDTDKGGHYNYSAVGWPDAGQYTVLGPHNKPCTVQQIPDNLAGSAYKSICCATCCK